MSRGALMQLVAKGEMDKYLYDENIKTSVFQNSIRRITNFSKSSSSVYPTGNVTWNEKATFKIKPIGDLLSNMYFVVKLPSLSVSDFSDNEITSEYRVKWQDYIGNFMIEKVTLRIGGQKIDEYTGEYLQFHTDLYNPSWSKLCMLGHDKSFIIPNTKIESQYVHIPLKFFFTDNITKSLPVLALSYQEIEVEIKLRPWSEVYLVLKQITSTLDELEKNAETSKLNFVHTTQTITQKNLSDIRLDCNYIFLEGEERKAIVDKKHEILITQTQHIKMGCSPIDNIYLNFNHPIKEFFYVIQSSDAVNNKEYFNFSGKPQYIPSDKTQISDILWNQLPNKHLLSEANLELNGIERIPTRDYKFWHHLQNYEHYRNLLQHNIYMYSFGLTTDENTGSCNFSVFDSIRLNIKLTDRTTEKIDISDQTNTISFGRGDTNTISIYAVNYNIFVIESGMGGVMYGS